MELHFQISGVFAETMPNVPRMFRRQAGAMRAGCQRTAGLKEHAKHLKRIQGMAPDALELPESAQRFGLLTHAWPLARPTPFSRANIP